MKKQIELARAVSGLIELADEQALRAAFGAALPAVMALDPQPMLLRAAGLLDKGNVVNGKQTWVFGYYGFYLTDEQFRNEFVPALLNAPGYEGHIDPATYEPPVLTVKWVGMDERTGTPGAILYIESYATELRAAVQSAAAQGGNWGRKFPLSLRMGLDVDWETNAVIGITDPERSSLDLVRMQGTKGAGVKSAVLLNDNGEGDGAMELTFKSEDELRNSGIVKNMVAEQVALAIGKPERVKEIALSAPIEMLKEREDVKPFLSRQSREDVLKSLTTDELKVQLAAREELRAAATAMVTELAAKVAEFTKGTAREILLAELGKDDKLVDRTIAAHDFAHMDPERVKSLARTVKVALGLSDAKPGTTEDPKKGDFPGSATGDAEIKARQKSFESRFRSATA